MLAPSRLSARRVQTALVRAPPQGAQARNNSSYYARLPVRAMRDSSAPDPGHSRWPGPGGKHPFLAYSIGASSTGIAATVFLETDNKPGGMSASACSKDAGDVVTPAPAPAGPPAPVADSPSKPSPAQSETPCSSIVSNQLALRLVSGGFMIPHPAKVLKGGEDAYYVDRSGRSLGVADGVSAWAESGIDAGEYSRSLMREARKAAEADAKRNKGIIDPTSILLRAHKRSQEVTGTSTACILCLNGSQLQASNIGDSGFMVVRDGHLIFESPQQQHGFNFPYQIGTRGDDVQACQRFSVDVVPGDVVIVGSDGLLDNVYHKKAAKVVWDAKCKGCTPGLAAQQLATFAANRSRDPVYVSPFAKSAREAGFYYRGGKVDDITVLVAYIMKEATGDQADLQATA